MEHSQTRPYPWPTTELEADTLVLNAIRTMFTVKYIILMIPLYFVAMTLFVIAPFATVLWLLRWSHNLQLTPGLVGMTVAWFVYCNFGTAGPIDKLVAGTLEKVFHVPLTNESVRTLAKVSFPE